MAAQKTEETTEATTEEAVGEKRVERVLDLINALNGDINDDDMSETVAGLSPGELIAGVSLMITMLMQTVDKSSNTKSQILRNHYGTVGERIAQVLGIMINEVDNREERRGE